MGQQGLFKAVRVCFHFANDIVFLYYMYGYIHTYVFYTVLFCGVVNFRISLILLFFRITINLGGANAMVKSAATYAGIAYITEMLLPSYPKKSQFEFTDYDLPEETSE